MKGRIWLVRQGLHLADCAAALRGLGLEVRELERRELAGALEAGPRPHAVLDPDLADASFQAVLSRGIPVVAVMLDHWYSSLDHRPTPGHRADCERLGLPLPAALFVDVRFRRREGGPGPGDRLYVFTCAPEQVPVFLAREGVRHAEALLFGVDAGRFRPLELTEEERKRFASPVGFVGTALLNNPLDGVRLLREGLAQAPPDEAKRLGGLVDELIRLQTRDLFRWRVPELILEMEGKHGADFISPGGMTPEKGTWAIFLGVHVSAIQRVAAVQALAPLGMAVHGSPEWGLLEGVDYRGFADHATELPKVINATDVNLNVSKPMFPSGVGPRILETLACGGFLLSNRLHGIEALFEDGKDLVYYDGVQDLVAKARHYLAHPEERREIGQRGRRKVLEAHTWTHRARRIVEVLQGDGVLPV